MIAAGMYLRTLREGRGMSRKEIAAALKTSPSQIERIENGEQETRGSLLFGFVDAVRGSAEHVQRLLLSAEASENEGERLARSWLGEIVDALKPLPEEGLTPDEQAIISRLTPQQRAAVVEVARQMLREL